MQKSKESFRKLLEIVGSTEYHPEDVRDTDYQVLGVEQVSVDAKEGGNCYAKGKLLTKGRRPESVRSKGGAHEETQRPLR